MKVLAIICEYNPFHNGHKYLIDEAKKLTEADVVIALMSGDFTQQGNVAIYDKFTRAKMSTEANVDIVAELPAVFATSSAQHFATAAVKILDSLNCVNYLAFGSECGDIEILNNISNKITSCEDALLSKTKEVLESGISFAEARYKALESLLTADELAEAKKSNNILAIEYLNALKKLNSKIEPVTIKRAGENFYSDNLSSFASATAIRNIIYREGTTNSIKDVVPENVYSIIENTPYLSNENLFYILKYKILSLDIAGLKNINEVNEGLENKIFKAIGSSNSYESLVSSIKSKRYKESKIKRALINVLLNITKADFETMKNKESYYFHILSASKKGKKYLPYLSEASIPIIIKKKDFDKIEDPVLKNMINYDMLASNIHSTLNNESINKDLTNKL